MLLDNLMTHLLSILNSTLDFHKCTMKCVKIEVAVSERRTRFLLLLFLKNSVKQFVPVFLTAGQAVLAEGMSGTRAYGWHTLSLTVKVS